MRKVREGRATAGCRNVRTYAQSGNTGLKAEHFRVII
jgi:uncharacterized protein (DUF1697 family)